MRFDANPGINRVIAIGILIFFDILIGAMLALLETTPEPTTRQVIIVFLTAAGGVVAYFLGFLKKGEEIEEG